MSKVIKGGTIVAADRSYEADVLIEGMAGRRSPPPCGEGSGVGSY